MSGRRSDEIRGSAKKIALGRIAGWLMRLVTATLRVRVEDLAGVGGRGSADGPVIFALWHSRIFVVPPVWRRTCPGRHAVVLTSASRDGAALEAAVGVFGIGAVRGSSSRRGAAALVALRRAVRDGSDACVTPDGPRGPRYEVQGGIVKLAQATGAPIVPIHVRFAKAWRLKTWDRFVIPLPFSRVHVVFDEALAVPAHLAEDAFEATRAALEERLRRGTDDLGLPSIPRRKK